VESSLIAEVRRASDLTMQVGTARISHAMEFRAGAFGRIVDILAASEKDPPLSKTASGAWSLVGRGIKLAENAADGKTTRNEGVADFRSGGCVTTHRTFGRRPIETYFQPGRLLERRPGERWREKLARFDGSFRHSPIWLVELPRGATEAVAVNEEPVDGVPCRHVSGMADPELAATRSIHGMERAVGDRASGQLVPYEVWIDRTGRLRRVRAAIEITDPEQAGQKLSGSNYEVTLSELGEAPPLPAADDVEPVVEARPHPLEGSLGRTTTDQDALLGRFIARTAPAMADRGWQVDPTAPPDGTVFLGSFQQAVDGDWLATVDFILESGPTHLGAELTLAGLRQVERFQATVGGELGVRHLPTARLIRLLDVLCETNVSRELDDIAEEEGLKLPTMIDADSVDEASRTLVRLVDAHAMRFARDHADIDKVVAFLASGGQNSRDREFEYIFVPTLLAASGRHSEARAALADYRQRPKTDPAEDATYASFADKLTSWLDKPSVTS
jgi:hypothetical protein